MKSFHNSESGFFTKVDENRVVLYKKGRQLGLGFYIIEISTAI